MNEEIRYDSQKIVDVEISSEIRKAFLDYSMSVIVSRALPDVRDGLKPVHRRILYAMYDNNLYPTNPYRKCATTVGEVLGHYHPHGDASVYDAMVRLRKHYQCDTFLLTVTATSALSTATLRLLPLHRVKAQQDGNENA